MSHPSKLGRDQLEAFWMPFTANRQFKDDPRILTRADGMHYWTDDDRRILDGVAGLWCVNAGHSRKEITRAVSEQIDKMEYAPPFQMGHPGAFQLANEVAGLMPDGLDHVFFTNSGSESVDTALKIALAYQRVRGEGTRTRFVGRERGYHGVGFGGISVGGMVNNRKWFGSMLPGVDHLPHTHSLKNNAFTRGQPAWGAHRADELERIVALHDASTIAAVIVEPVAGSTGVLIPPKGYLQRLREICDHHGILLIFDEVISGFGRLGANFASQYFGVTPDMITMAKGLSNGAVPIGAVGVRKEIYDAFMHGPDNAVELFHGYTYSAHPVACAAALATQQIYQKEGLFERASKMAKPFADAIHALKGLPHVQDIRNLGLVGAVDLESIPGKPGTRAFKVFRRAFENGILVRVTGDVVALSPPLIIDESQIDELFGTLGEAIREAD
jgi:beta-alanine--pyruvate transaminase